MADDVNPKRRYDSPRRREQAAATGELILDSAERLFVEQGFATTTMAMIATDAGVALKTVYLAFETKSGVLRGLWDRQLRGAAEIPVADQPWFREIGDEPDAATKLRLNARNGRAVKVRIGPVLAVIRDAAPTDPPAQALWDLIQSDFYANQRSVVEQLDGAHALREGLDVTRATDILWTLAHPDVWQLLVGTRGWSPADYEAWFAEASVTQLLAPTPPARQRRRAPG